MPDMIQIDPSDPDLIWVQDVPRTYGVSVAWIYERLADPDDPAKANDPKRTLASVKLYTDGKLKTFLFRSQVQTAKQMAAVKGTPPQKYLKSPNPSDEN